MSGWRVPAVSLGCARKGTRNDQNRHRLAFLGVMGRPPAEKGRGKGVFVPEQ